MPSNTPGPDFLIIGAMKCGTSTLQAQLAAQPGIFMTTPKEPNYFSDDAVFARGPDWYAELFAGAAPGELTGEASTHYTKLPTHPATLDRLAATGLQPKLIYLIRDPVARAVSHYLHEWTMGNMGADVAAEFRVHPELIDYGRYGMQLAPWVECFGREAVLVSSLEAMTRDPQRLLERAGRHIGHPEPLVWQEAQGRMNASAERIRRFPLHGLLIDNRVSTALRRTLVPQGLRDRIKRARRRDDRPAPPADLVREMHVIFAEDQARLMAMVAEDPQTRADVEVAYPFLAQ